MSYNYWWDSSKLKTCPVCYGTGMDNDSLDHKCYHCNGVGKVDIDNEDKKTISDKIEV